MPWYYKSDHEEIGPVSNQSLRQLAADGTITPQTQVRRAEETRWKTAGRLKGLFSENPARVKTRPKAAPRGDCTPSPALASGESEKPPARRGSSQDTTSGDMMGPDVSGSEMVPAAVVDEVKALKAATRRKSRPILSWLGHYGWILAAAVATVAAFVVRYLWAGQKRLTAYLETQLPKSVPARRFVAFAAGPLAAVILATGGWALVASGDGAQGDSDSDVAALQDQNDAVGPDGSASSDPLTFARHSGLTRELISRGLINDAAGPKMKHADVSGANQSSSVAVLPGGDPGLLASAAIGASIGDSFSAIVKARQTSAKVSAEMTEQLAAARRDFWEAYPDGPDINAKRKRFASFLFSKDFLFAMTDINERNAQRLLGNPVMFGRGSNLSISGLAGFSKLDTDGGLAPGATTAYYAMVKSVTDEKIQFRFQDAFAALPKLLYARTDAWESYLMARDRYEYWKAGHEADLFKTDEAFLLYVARTGKALTKGSLGTKIPPLSHEKAVAWAKELESIFGTSAVRYAAGKLRRAKTDERGQLSSPRLLGLAANNTDIGSALLLLIGQCSAENYAKYMLYSQGSTEEDFARACENTSRKHVLQVAEQLRTAELNDEGELTTVGLRSVGLAEIAANDTSRRLHEPRRAFRYLISPSHFAPKSANDGVAQTAIQSVIMTGVPGHLKTLGQQKSVRYRVTAVTASKSYFDVFIGEGGTAEQKAEAVLRVRRRDGGVDQVFERSARESAVPDQICNGTVTILPGERYARLPTEIKSTESGAVLFYGYDGVRGEFRSGKTIYTSGKAAIVDFKSGKFVSVYAPYASEWWNKLQTIRQSKDGRRAVEEARALGHPEFGIKSVAIHADQVALLSADKTIQKYSDTHSRIYLYRIGSEQPYLSINVAQDLDPSGNLRAMTNPPSVSYQLVMMDGIIAVLINTAGNTKDRLVVYDTMTGNRIHTSDVPTLSWPRTMSVKSNLFGYGQHIYIAIPAPKNTERTTTPEKSNHTPGSPSAGTLMVLDASHQFTATSTELPYSCTPVLAVNDNVLVCGPQRRERKSFLEIRDRKSLKTVREIPLKVRLPDSAPERIRQQQGGFYGLPGLKADYSWIDNQSCTFTGRMPVSGCADFWFVSYAHASN